MAKKILISFKENKEDLALYDEIMKHSNVSGYIKDILKGLENEKGIRMMQMPVNFVFNDEDSNG